MATITVGARQQYATIAAAVAAARSGDLVSVLAGTYSNDFAVIRTDITLAASGGQVVLTATGALAPGGALLTSAANAIVDGFVFLGAHASDGTAAGLLQTAGTLTVRNSLFNGNQTGLLSTAGSTATVSVQRTEFAGNGNSSAFSANIAVAGLQSLSISDSYVHDAAGGDEVRSLAHATTVLNSRINDNAAIAATVLNLPNGGTVSVQDSVLQKGARSTTASVVRFGGGAVYGSSTLSLVRNTLVTDKPGTFLVQNGTTATAMISSNQISGFTAASVNTGPATLSGNTVVASRPAVPTAPLLAYYTGTPTQYGKAGAIVANGTVLKVGAGGPYGTLAAALAAAHDGDTVAVAAGTYALAPITVTHKVIIQGVGGIAGFTAASTGAALFTTATDVTFRNIEVSGLGAAARPGAAISATGGALTVVNSTIHDNAAGIVATGATTTLGIYDTEVARNGTPNGFGANVAAAAINTLTLSNAYVHDALAGPEVSSAAAYTSIDATRISEAAGNGATDLVLPTGGRVTVTNSVFEKGAASQAVPLVKVGGGTISAGSTIGITGTTLVSDLATAPTVFVSGDPAATTTLSNNTFVGGASGSTQAVNATVSGAMVATGVSVTTDPPFTRTVSSTGASVAPTVPLTTPIAPAATAQRGLLVLDVSETGYHGDAQFQLLVDGASVGGTLTTTASHAAGQSQSFTIGGTFAPGPHTVALTFVNALSGAPGAGARTLSLDGAHLNGAAFGQPVTLAANGTTTLSTETVAGVATPVTVSLSEDAWHGDAQALVTIDGKPQEGVQVVTASHALHGTEPMRFLPMLAPGTHTLGVIYLNDASGPTGDRNLYVDAVDVAGQHIGAATALLTGGTSNYAFTVPVPPAVQNANLFVRIGIPQAASMIVPAH